MNILENLTPDQQSLLLFILTSFPLALIMKLITNPNAKKIYNLVIGICLPILMYGSAFIHIAVSSIIVYLLVKYTSRLNIGRTVTLYAFAYLSILHLYRQLYDYGSWRMDITTIFMILALKFSSFGYCYQDGGLKVEEVPKFMSNYKVQELDLFDYLGYIYFFPTGLMGPFIEYKDFNDYINCRGDYSKIPSVLVPSILRLLQAILACAIYLYFKDVFTVHHYLNSSGFAKVIAFFLLLCQKCKFYVAFIMSESICRASGITFERLHNEKNADFVDSFDKIINVKVKECEINATARGFFKNWNISVHNYLKRYIYFRNSPKGTSSAKGQMLTFLVSALWHGFYPCYYVVFFHFGIGIFIEIQFENIIKLYKSSYLEYFIRKLNFVGFFLIGNYCVGIVEALDYPVMLEFMNSLHFIPTLLVIVVCFINQVAIYWAKSSRKADK